jgi:hypothetical protein
MPQWVQSDSAQSLQQSGHSLKDTKPAPMYVAAGASRLKHSESQIELTFAATVLKLPTIPEPPFLVLIGVSGSGQSTFERKTFQSQKFSAAEHGARRLRRFSVRISTRFISPKSLRTWKAARKPRAKPAKA